MSLVGPDVSVLRNTTALCIQNAQIELGIRVTFIRGFSERLYRFGVVLAEDELHAILKVSSESRKIQ